MTVEYDDTNGGVIMCVSLGLFLIVIAFLSWAFFFHPNAILKKHLPNRQFKCVECHHTEHITDRFPTILPESIRVSSKEIMLVER